MQRFNRKRGQDGTSGRKDGPRLLSAGGRMKIVAAVAAVVLTFGVVAAYGALGAHDTATGTFALQLENGGDRNTADGYEALYWNSTGTFNTAVGYYSAWSNTTGVDNVALGDVPSYLNTTGSFNVAVGEGTLYSNVSSDKNTALGTQALSESTGEHNTAVGAYAGAAGHSNTTGSNNTFLGYQAAPGTNTQIDNATAVGANSVVSQSNSLVLGAPGVNVGVNTATPQSRIQIGNGSSSTWGDYLQLPVVTNTAKTPPADECNNTTLVGRTVIQQVKKKMILWGCSTAGVWTKM